MFRSIGEILREKVLVNHKGEPYKHKATVSKLLANKPHKVIKSPFGDSKIFSQEVIDELNARWDNLNIKDEK